MKKLLVSMFLGVALLFVCSSAQANDFDFSGTFAKDNDIVALGFTVGEDSTITIFSSSWLYANPPAGGSLGGFDPILAIWDSAGGYVSEQDDGHNVGSTLSKGVLYDHGSWDSYYDVFLSAGNYTATIAQYSNFRDGTNLSEGFRYDGNDNFTFDMGYGGATQPYFNGIWDSNDPRTANWEFHILNVAEAHHDVPEPATMLLLGFGLLGLGLARKKS